MAHWNVRYTIDQVNDTAQMEALVDGTAVTSYVLDHGLVTMGVFGGASLSLDDAIVTVQSIVAFGRRCLQELKPPLDVYYANEAGPCRYERSGTPTFGFEYRIGEVTPTVALFEATLSTATWILVVEQRAEITLPLMNFIHFFDWLLYMLSHHVAFVRRTLMLGG